MKILLSILKYILMYVVLFFIFFAIEMDKNDPGATLITALILPIIVLVLYHYWAKTRKSKKKIKDTTPISDSINENIQAIELSDNPAEALKKVCSPDLTAKESKLYLSAVAIGQCNLGEPPAKNYQELITENCEFVAKRNEAAIFFTACTEIKTLETERHYEAGSRGIGLHVAKGVTFRLGRIAGKSVRRLKDVYFNGSPMMVTTKNIYFRLGEDSERIDFKKITSIQREDGGNALKVSQEGARSKPITFYFENTIEAEAIERIIKTDWP